MWVMHPYTTYCEIFFVTSIVHELHGRGQLAKNYFFCRLVAKKSKIGRHTVGIKTCSNLHELYIIRFS
jgi:hypothetical protein